MPPRLYKLLQLTLRPTLWPVVTFRVFPALEHHRAFSGLEFDTVIDAGANKGQFAAFAVNRWKRAKLICFEPLSEPRAILTKVLNHLAKHRALVKPLALGNKSGSVEIHIASREDSSSLLKLGSAQKTLFKMSEERSELIDVARLDEQVSLHPDEKNLLKIDVQGFEFELLQGTTKLFDHLDAIYVECSFIELYEHQKLAGDVSHFLNDHGFNEVGRFNSFYANDTLVQADLLFLKSPTEI